MRENVSIWAELERLGASVGGRGFALTLALSAIFSIALFHMRADPIFTLPASLSEAGWQDFIAFWRGGVLALEGRAAAAYDPALFREGFPEPAQTLLFLNPPQFFLLLWPFGALSYGAAKALWLLLNALAFAGIAAMASRNAVQGIAFAVFLFCSPAAFAALLPAQISPLVAAGLLAALVFSDRRPLIAGLLFALLTVKPQYALLAPAFLAARGEWRAFAAAAAFSAMFAGLTWLVFGTEVWRAFFESLAGTHMTHAANLSPSMFSIHQTVDKLGGGLALKLAAQAGVIAICAGAVFMAARRWRREAAIGFTLIATTFVSPSLWVYDWPLFAAGLFMLARTSTPWPRALQVSAAALWLIPIFSLGLGTLASSLLPPAIIAVTLAVIYVYGEKPFSAGYSGSTGIASSPALSAS